MRYSASQLVAHRGWPARFPENTATGIAAAVQNGAEWLEFDVQLTRDRVPVLFHDDSLARSCGRPECVTELRFDQLPYGANRFASQYGEAFSGLGIDPLAAVCNLLDQHDRVRAFVELKSESAGRHGATEFWTPVDETLQRLANRQSVAAVISKDAKLCRLARAKKWPIGFVVHDGLPEQWEEAAALAPEYLFCNLKRLPQDPKQHPAGDWVWVGYTLNDANEIIHWLNRGMDIVETDDIGLLNASGETAG